MIPVIRRDRSGQSSGSSESLSSSTGKVEREKFTDVVGNHRYQVNNLLDKLFKPREPSIIVKEACAMVGRELQYHVDTYNCEHFAIEMRYGKAESRQFNGKPGDLIEINRGPYKQWAVYIGENEVVHFGTEGVQSSGSSESLSSSKGKVKCEKFTDVVGNHRYQVNNLLDKTFEPREPSIIVKEACEMVGRELQYDLVKYSCEHFAIEMRYGKAESLQVCI
ncbi:phospholipase A and acyltransferase 4-like [Limanda limanda]|uniref:phospholipase A and acyltransferase 4-like n=1 Tax=Limanda limanda TaxID=27771 RepID=UPI0029C90BFA|nr:phospholipase A and acyltransferase 4-like [Limanda limanda]